MCECWKRVKNLYPAVAADALAALAWLHLAVTAACLCPQVRDSDAKDVKRDRVVHLIDDFRITGENGERILLILTPPPPQKKCI